MLADEAPQWDAYAPAKYGGSPISITVYVPDVDAVVKKAVKAGGKLTREVKDQFYGDRSGGIDDPFGHHWHIATHIEDVPPKEMKRRMAAMAKGG
jgi:PhnB protein